VGILGNPWIFGSGSGKILFEGSRVFLPLVVTTSSFFGYPGHFSDSPALSVAENFLI